MRSRTWRTNLRCDVQARRLSAAREPFPHGWWPHGKRGTGPRPWPTSCSRDLPRCARRDWRTGTRVQDRWRVVWLIGACTDPRVQPRFLQRTQGGTSCAETLEGLRLLQSNVNLACIRHLLDHVSVRTTEDYDRLAAGVMLRESRPPTPRPAGLPMPATYGNPPQNASYVACNIRGTLARRTGWMRG